MIEWLVGLILRILERMKKNEKISNEKRIELALQTIANMGIYNHFI